MEAAGKYSKRGLKVWEDELLAKHGTSRSNETQLTFTLASVSNRNESVVVSVTLSAVHVNFAAHWRSREHTHQDVELACLPR